MQILTKTLASGLRFCLLLFGAFLLSGQKPPTREYQVKAVFIFNFAHFVEWPARCFATPQSPVTIGILGKDPFGNYLEETLTNETINNRPMSLRHFNTVDEVTDCHVLFININDKAGLRTIIEKLKGKNILTIGEASEFPKLGGMIRLYTRDDKINIQVNLDEARSEQLVVSSKLLKLAEIVKTNK